MTAGPRTRPRWPWYTALAAGAASAALRLAGLVGARLPEGREPELGDEPLGLPEVSRQPCPCTWQDARIMTAHPGRASACTLRSTSSTGSRSALPPTMPADAVTCRGNWSLCPSAASRFPVPDECTCPAIEGGRAAPPRSVSQNRGRPSSRGGPRKDLDHGGRGSRAGECPARQAFPGSTGRERG